MIEIIAGTNRPASSSLKLARQLEGYYREAGAEAQVLNLQDLPPEIFHPSSYAAKPAAFLPFAQRVLDSAGLHIVTPEYNGSFPGVLKYFIDMLKFPESFERRPVAFTGLANGLWGALRAVEQLQMVFAYRNAHILPQRVWIPSVKSVLPPGAERIEDEALVKRLREQTVLFREFTELLAKRKG